jgi:ABC-2 type transport system permease protein
MRTLRFLLEKEFRQIFRNKTILKVLIGLPIIQLVILPLAANYEVRNINLAVVDHDHSTDSRRLIAEIDASQYFNLAGYNPSFKEAMKLIESDRADLILEIPEGFERNLVRENHQNVFVAVNAINGVKANLGGAYLGNIIRNFNEKLRIKLSVRADMMQVKQIEVVPSNWFNPLLDYHKFMVPGILALLVTMIGGFFSAMNIVKEKETGTMEQINVTPIKKYHFILGKLIPFWVLGTAMFSIGLVIAWLVYGIIPVGSLLLLYCFIGIYLVAILGFGLLVSTFCQTQQQAIFVMFFFIMIFILMSGLFTSIESMPNWAYVISRFNPVSYLIEILRMIMLKGSGWHDALPNLLIITLFAVILNLLAVFNYKKTS